MVTRGLNSVVREFGSSVGNGYFPNFVAHVESSFVELVRTLQKRGRCRHLVAIMNLDLNLGEDHIIHNTVTVNPHQELLPPIEASADTASSQIPVHDFLTRTKASFTGLVRVLEAADVIATYPCMLTLSLVLDHTHHSCVVSLPQLPLVDSEQDTSDPTNLSTDRNDAGSRADGNDTNDGAHAMHTNSGGTGEEPSAPPAGGTTPAATEDVPQNVNMTHDAGHVADHTGMSHGGGDVVSSNVVGIARAARAARPAAGQAATVTNDSSTTSRARPARRLRGPDGDIEPRAVIWGPVRVNAYWERFRRASPP